MKEDSTKTATPIAEGLLFDNWFDAIEDGVRSRVRDFIEAMLEKSCRRRLRVRATAGGIRAPRPGRWRRASATVIGSVT